MCEGVDPLLPAVDDVDELRLERGAAYEEAVDVALLGEVGGVAGGHRAAVDDPYGCRQVVADVVRQPVTEHLVHVLRLFRRRRLPGAYRPHRLVGDHYI